MAGWKFYLNGIQVAEPIGWDAIEFTAKRLPSHGIDSPFSTELTFNGKGAKLIKAEYDVHYINAEIAILIQSDVKVNGSAYAFNGFLNLSIYSEANVCDTNGWEITVGIIEDNFRERFLARQNVEIDLLSEKDLDENAIPALTLDTITTHCQELFLIAKAKNYSDSITTLQWTYAGGWTLDEFAALLPAYYANSDFKGVFGNTFDPISTLYTTTSPTFVNNSNFTRTIKLNVTANGIFGWTAFGWAGDSANITFSIQVRNSTIETQRYYLYDSPLNYYDDANDTAWSFSAEKELILDPDDRVFVFMQWGFNGNIVPGVTPTPDTISRRLAYKCENVCLNITELNSSANASTTSGLKVFNALQRAVYQLTGDPDGLLSDTFTEDTGCYWNHLLTTGLYLRNADTIESAINGCTGEETAGQVYAIKTSFQKLFEGLNRIFCLGWQFEQDTYGSWKLRLEKADYFFNSNLLIQTFPKVGQIMQNAMSEKLVNNIQLGYSDKFKNIAISALTEINADRNYFIANKARADNSSVTLNLLSDIIASGYAIEFYRRLQFLRDDSGSSDRPNDYDLFIIWINRYEVTVDTVESSGYDLPGETGAKTFAPGTVSYGSNFIAESNGPIDRVYNVYLSPARIAARWWKILGMHTYKLPTAKAILSFQVGQYFTNYSSRIDSTSEPDECMEVLNDSSTVLYENTNIGPDILVTDEAEYLMKPISVEFDAPQTLCSFIDMANNGTGLVRVTSGSLDLYGYIQESSNKPQDPNSGLSTLKLTLAYNVGSFGRAFSDGFSDGFS